MSTTASSVAMHDAEQLLSHPHLLGEVHARACALLGDALRERAESLLQHNAVAALGSTSASAAASSTPHSHHAAHPALSALTSSPLSLPSGASLGSGLLAPTSSVLQAASAESSARASRNSKLWWERRRARVCGGASAAAAMDAAASSAATPAIPASCRALDRSVGLPFPLSAAALLHRLTSLLSTGHSSIPDSIDVLVRLMEEEAAHEDAQAEAGQTLPFPTSSLSDPALASSPLPDLPFQTAYVDFLIYLAARLDSAAAEGRALVQFAEELDAVEKQRAAAWNQNQGADTSSASVGAYSSPVYGCLSYLQRAMSMHLSREWPLDLNSSRGAFVLLLLEHEVMSQLLAQWLINREKTSGGSDANSEEVQVFARLVPQTATLEGQQAQHAKDAANPFYKAPLHANFRLHYAAAVPPVTPHLPAHAFHVRNAGAPVPIPAGGSVQRAALHPRDLFLTAHDVHSLIAQSFAQTVHDHLCPRAASAAQNSGAGTQIGAIRIQQRASTPFAAAAAATATLPPFSAQLDLLHQRLVHPPAIPSTPHARIHVPASAPPSAPLGPASPVAAASPLARTRSREIAAASAAVLDPYAATPNAALSALAMERPSSRHQAFSFRRGDSNTGDGAAVLAAAVMQHRIDRERAEANAASTAAATAASALANQPASASRPASSPSLSAASAFAESPLARTGSFVPRAALSSRGGDRVDSPTRAAQAQLQQQQLNAEESKEEQDVAGSNVPADLLAARRASQANTIAAATAAAAASRRVPQPSSVPRPSSASDVGAPGVRVHNNMLSPHPARGFVLRLHDAALPSKLLVVAVPEQRAPEPPNPHVHPPPEEAAAAKAARLKAARSGKKVRKASSAAYAPVAATSLQPEMAARMHTGFEQTFIPNLISRMTADHRLGLPASADAQSQSDPEATEPVRPQTARALMSKAYTAFFHSPHARALQSALTGQVAPPQTGVSTVAAAVPQSTLAALAATSRAPVDDLLGVHARSGAGQHAALTSRSRHWHKQHSLKTELARLALVAQYAAARPPPGSAPSPSKGIATAATAAAAGGWMHTPSTAAIRDRLGSTSLASPRAPPPPALSDLPRPPQLEHPFGKEAASVSRVVQHGMPLSVSAAAETSDWSAQQSDRFANPADWMRSASPDEARPKSQQSARARGSAAPKSSSPSAQQSPRDDVLTGFEAESKEQPSTSALGISHDLTALTAHVRSASLHQAAAHPAHAKHLSMHETMQAEQAQAHAQGLRAAAKAKAAAEAAQAEAAALHERKVANATRDRIIAASTAEAAAEAVAISQQDQPILSGSSDPSLPAAVPTVIFRSGEHVAPAGSPIASTPLRPTSSAIPATVVAGSGDSNSKAVIAGMRGFIEGIKTRDGLDHAALLQQAALSARTTDEPMATVRKPSQPPQQQQSPAPQLTLRNNAAPAASRVRTARMAAAVSAFATAARVDPAKPVLDVKPLLSATSVTEEENDATGMSGLSARMRMMLAFGAHSAREQQAQQQQQQGQTKAPQNFPMRQPLGSSNAHHAREAAAALALSSGSPAALPAPTAPTRVKPASALGNMLLVSKFTRRLKTGAKKKQRGAKTTAGVSEGESGTEGEGDDQEKAESETDAAASPRSYRRSWFDVKMSAAGPTRTQLIAERQRELAWAIHRQRIEAEQARAAAAGGDAAAEIAQFGGSYTSAARMHERAKRSTHMHTSELRVEERRPQPTRNKSFARQRSMAARAQTAAATAGSRTSIAVAYSTAQPADILVVEH